MRVGDNALHLEPAILHVSVLPRFRDENFGKGGCPQPPLRFGPLGQRALPMMPLLLRRWAFEVGCWALEALRADDRFRLDSWLRAADRISHGDSMVRLSLTAFLIEANFPQISSTNP
jgi:hypothetical protein